MKNQRHLIVYIAASLDGYIAQPNDDLSFLKLVEKEGEDYGYNAFYETVDTIIIGRKTYDWVVKAVGSFPHAQKTTYVITRHPRPSIGNTHFYTGNMEDLVTSLKSTTGGSIFCDGGAEIINELTRLNLIDEWYISIIPILLGNGVRLFNGGFAPQQLQLLESTSFETGLVQLHYANN